MNPRLAWSAGLVATALELTVSWGLPAAMPGHSLLDDYISTAGATGAPHPVLFAVLGIVAAALHLVFVVGLWRKDDAPLHRVAVALFAAFFVFLAGGLSFQCDPGCALRTTEAWIHFGFGLSAFLCLGLAALAVLYGCWKARDGRLGVASAVVAVLDVLLLLSDQTQVLRGLTERLTLAAMAVWGALWMLRLSAPATAGNPATSPR